MLYGGPHARSCTCAKSLGILGILAFLKYNQSSAYKSCALYTNFYISDISIAHIGDLYFERGYRC